jgi:hypothetical protein
MVATEPEFHLTGFGTDPEIIGRLLSHRRESSEAPMTYTARGHAPAGEVSLRDQI